MQSSSARGEIVDLNVGKSARTVPTDKFCVLIDGFSRQCCRPRRTQRRNPTLQIIGGAIEYFKVYCLHQIRNVYQPQWVAQIRAINTEIPHGLIPSQHWKFAKI